MKRTHLPLAVLALSVAGCASMAPRYERPTAPVPAVFPTVVPAAPVVAPKAEAKPLAEIPWKEFFIDSRLQKVISQALSNNRDLRIAALNIERYRALYQIKKADLLPKVDASASATYQRIAEDFSGTGLPKQIHQYNIGLGVSAYELDFFGRVQSLKDQALEQYLATEQAQRSVQISLVSQVAGAYLTLAADRERLRLARETLASQQESFTLIKSRFDAGIANALTLSQAQTTLEAARVDIARFTALAAQDENALALLVGSPIPAENLPQTLAESLTALQDLPPGASSDLLLNRPDILQAEGQLKGFNANIGAARAAFFPRITLSSSVGLGSNELSSLFNNGAYVWSIIPRITLPIFDGGSNDATLSVALFDRDIALAQYEKTIQTAFREVADALAQRGTIDEQLAAQQSLTDATAESQRISRARFEKGVDSYLTVLDSQRALYSAQQNLIGIRQTRLANMMTLYKVLGGGSR